MDKTLHILIVEDSLIAQIVIKKQMEGLGCLVETADDGSSALEKAMLKPYDLILMDIGLGDGPDGFEVSISIKQQSQVNKETPIMAVTSHGEPEFATKAQEVGMVGYYNKPFTPSDAKKILDYFNN